MWNLPSRLKRFSAPPAVRQLTESSWKGESPALGEGNGRGLRLAGDLENEHGGALLPSLGRKSDDGNAVLPRYFEFASGRLQQIGRLHFVTQAAHAKDPAGRTLKRVQVDAISLHRTASPRELSHRTGTGAVDALAVTAHPGTYLLQHRDARRRDGAVGHGTDVEQVVAAFADDLHDNSWSNLL